MKMPNGETIKSLMKIPGLLAKLSEVNFQTDKLPEISEDLESSEIHIEIKLVNPDQVDVLTETLPDIMQIVRHLDVVAAFLPEAQPYMNEIERIRVRANPDIDVDPDDPHIVYITIYLKNNDAITALKGLIETLLLKGKKK